MLGLYLDTPIIGYICCSMLSILKDFILQNELQNLMTNTVFWDKT